MKDKLGTYNTPELVIIAKENGLDIPVYSSGKAKEKKSVIIDKMIKHGIKVDAKVESVKVKSKKAEKPVFKRNKPMSVRRKTRRA